MATARSISQAALPGGAAVDNKLLDQAVICLNRIHRERGLEYARQIGSYLLTTFFNNRRMGFERFGDSHLSFRELARREDLDMSASKLYKCVAVELQYRALPLELANGMSFSHHVLLLPVRDVATKISFARQAVREGWSVREFKRHLRSQRGTNRAGSGRPAGRPRLPAFVKGTRQVGRAIEVALAEELTAEALQSLSVEQAHEVLGELESHIEQLQSLKRTLRDALS